MAKGVRPRDRRGMRTGFTTGACAAAAAKAAARCLVRGHVLTEIETVLPNRQRVAFALERSEILDGSAVCSVIKDAGDDPDCTHGAELVALVELSETAGVAIRGGDGVATVTKPGLGLDVGGSAINPVPRRNITQMVLEELVGTRWRGATVTVSVPGGQRMAEKTTNARLGLVGGISILGTSGIVRPYSTAAFKASVVQAVDVLRELGGQDVVFTTGGKSETYAMQLFPALPLEAFVQMGDFIGVAVRRAAHRQIRRGPHRRHDGQAVQDGGRAHADPCRWIEREHELACGAGIACGREGDRRQRDSHCNDRATSARAMRRGRRLRCALRRSASASSRTRRLMRAETWRSRRTWSTSAVRSWGATRTGTTTERRMTDMRQMTAQGRAIETGSFSIIDREVGEHSFDPSAWQIVRRVIHATADFEFARLVELHPDAVSAGIAALRAGCPVVVDVRMIEAGLNSQRLGAYGCRVHHFISDPDVVATAKAADSTRAIEAMRKAHALGLLDGAVVAVGNAPTALLEVARLVRDAGVRPALIVGVPVGFVSAVESKEAVRDLGVPYIVARGRKGGSTIAVSIIHGLLALSTESS